MSAQLTRIHTLAACRKAVLPATLAVLMGAPALAPAAWNWGLAGPKIYWAEVIKSEQAAPADQPVGTTQDVPDTLYIHGDDLSICKAGSTTPVWTPAVTWSILVSMYDVNSPPAELVATCENENTIKAVCPTPVEDTSISGADSINGICAKLSSQFNDGQYIIDIAPKQQARDRTGNAYWVRGTSLGNMPVHVDSYWEWLDALQTHVDALQVNVDDLNTAVGMPYDVETKGGTLDDRITDLEENPSSGGCGTTEVTLSNGAGTTSNLSSFSSEYFSLVRPSNPDDNDYHNTAGVGCPGVLSSFSVALIGGSPGTGNSYVFTLYRNGQSTNISCTISGSSSDCTDITGDTSIPLVKGDVINVRSAPYDNPPGRLATVQATYTPSGGIPAPIF